MIDQSAPSSASLWRRWLAPGTIALSVAIFVWTMLVDLELGVGETARAMIGVAALWGPLGAIVYRCLRGRVQNRLDRAVLAAAASYAFTTPLYGAFACGKYWFADSDRLFYVAQALAALGVALEAWRPWKPAEPRKPTEPQPNSSPPQAERGAQAWLLRRLAAVVERCGRLDAALVLLLALSMLVTPRYKRAFETLPDGSQKLITHGDVTYLTAQCYELNRHTPALQQSVRAGIKERAYHMYPHLTAMLVARYSGQDDILRALTRYEFTVVEAFVCLLFFCLVRGVSGSRGAGLVAVATAYVLAIPAAAFKPLAPADLPYFYCTWAPHATSNLEPAVICSPQMYCSLPVVFGAMLCVLWISINLRHGRPLGTLALVAALMGGVMLRFRVQTALLLLPDVLLLLAIAWIRTRQWQLIAAGVAGMGVVGAQFLEMRLPVYYPETCELVIRTTMIMHQVPYLNAWPGADALREWLRAHTDPAFYRHLWQVLCAAMFAMLNMIGAPALCAACSYVARPSSWRRESWAYIGLVLWLTIGSVIGATCVATSYDYYSVGGQMLLMVGWYVTPLAVIGAWPLVAWLAAWRPAARRAAPVLGVAVLAVTCVWQRIRGPSELQRRLCADGPTIHPAEWAAMRAMHAELPQDAVVLANRDFHPWPVALVSGVAGRRAYLEYLIDGHITGPMYEKNAARLARVEKVWQATSAAEFSAAMRQTGATHVLECASKPLGVRPTECLQPCWRSADDTVVVWEFHPPESGGDEAAVASNDSHARSPFHALPALVR